MINQVPTSQSFVLMFFPEMADQSCFWCINSTTIIDLASEMNFWVVGLSDIFAFFEFLNWFLHSVKLLLHLLIERLCFLEFLLKLRYFLGKLFVFLDDDFVIFYQLINGIRKWNRTGVYVGEKGVFKMHR